MDKAVKERWIAALESGKYRKARQRLRNKAGGMCCLGVLCDILPEVKWEGDTAIYESSRNDTSLPFSLTVDLGLLRDEDRLAKLNDRSRGWSKVIQYIKKEL